MRYVLSTTSGRPDAVLFGNDHAGSSIRATLVSLAGVRHCSRVHHRDDMGRLRRHIPGQGRPMRAAILVAAFALAGCAAPLTADGSKVRQIQVAGQTNCKFLGIAEVTGSLVYSSVTEGRRDMLAQLRNQSVEEVAKATYENARSLFRIDSEN